METAAAPATGDDAARRDLTTLARGGALNLVGAAVTAPHPLLRAMLGAGTAWAAPSDAILVLVQLEGGNDGLNTVIPYKDEEEAV